MRIKPLQLAGIAVALVGGAAKDALADTTVTTATTTPLATSTAGNITINSGGSIAVTAGQAATTADGAGLNITNSGTLSSNNADNTTGILLSGGGSGTITSSSSISLIEDYTRTDSNSDGVLDGAFAQGTNRVGIRLAGGSFTGSITNSGVINVEGNNSAGILLNGLLTGDLSSSNAINVLGDNAILIGVTGGVGNGVVGNITTTGNYSARGLNATGVLLDAPVTGNVSINGTWAVSGFSATSRPTDVSHLGPDNLLLGGSVVDVRYGISQGLTIAGPGVELDTGENATTATLQSYGSAPVVSVSAGASANTVLGVDTHGFGLDVRGNITALGVYDNISATAIRIAGSGTHSVTVNGGATIDGSVVVASVEGDAYGMSIGSNATVSSILMRKAMTVSTLSDTTPGHTAYGFSIDAGATVNSINNSGTIIAQDFGQYGNATAIIDRSNTLTTITNTGSLIAQLTPTDPDPTDNVPPPATTGTANAIDVHLSSVNVTVNQNATVVFTDDDAVDNDAATVPAVKMVGNVLFGSGNDIFNLNAGTVTGDMSFGTGTDAFNVASGTTYTGALTHNDSVGSLSLTSSGAINLTSGTTNVGNATFNTGSVTTLQLASNPVNSANISATGTVTFANNATLRVVAPAGLPNSAPNQVVVSAASLSIDPGAHVLGNITGGSYIYNFDVSQVGNTLLASYVLKTPTQLGFGSNQAAAYQPMLAALRNDTAAATAVGAISDATTFNTAYAELMPSYSSASAELATTAIAQEQSATTNRLAATRLNNLNEVSAWAQEIGYVIDRTPPDNNGEEFRGNGFGFALGIDGPLNNGALFGLSASFIAADAEQPIRPDGRVSSSFGQVNAYLGSAWGPIDLDLVAGAGVGRMRERRFMEIGSFRSIAEANWWAYEGHGMLRASAPMSMSGGWLTMTPQVALTYVGLSEQGYAERNAGALNISADNAFTQRLWGDVGVEFSARLFNNGQTVVAPRLSLGYRANLITDGGERTFRYQGGSDFTLTDDSYGSGGPIVGVGVDATNGYSTLSVGYEGEFTDQINRHSLNVALRFRF
ncbi:MAG: autotransporter domain-containing protein [Proteobacteria bacterium]|nr:autotransporter domain-containing protein [Pseudomonadota bacterium]